MTEFEGILHTECERKEPRLAPSFLDLKKLDTAILIINTRKSKFDEETRVLVLNILSVRYLWDIQEEIENSDFEMWGWM